MEGTDLRSTLEFGLYEAEEMFLVHARGVVNVRIYFPNVVVIAMGYSLRRQ